MVDNAEALIYLLHDFNSYIYLFIYISYIYACLEMNLTNKNHRIIKLCLILKTDFMYWTLLKSSILRVVPIT